MSNISIDDIVVRCSKYSGFKLEWRIREGLLEIEEPGKPKSLLSLRLYHPEGHSLYEVYGRMRHWCISTREMLVLAAALQKSPAQVSNGSRWFIIDREGLPTPVSKLPARPADAQDANGDEFRPWFKTTGHLHIEEGKIVGMHNPSLSLEALQASLKKYLRHESALMSRFGEEDIEVSEADAFLEKLRDADDWTTDW